MFMAENFFSKIWSDFEIINIISVLLMFKSCAWLEFCETTSS